MNNITIFMLTFASSCISSVKVSPIIFKYSVFYLGANLSDWARKSLHEQNKNINHTIIFLWRLRARRTTLESMFLMVAISARLWTYRLNTCCAVTVGSLAYINLVNFSMSLHHLKEVTEKNLLIPVCGWQNLASSTKLSILSIYVKQKWSLINTSNPQILAIIYTW